MSIGGINELVISLQELMILLCSLSYNVYLLGDCGL